MASKSADCLNCCMAWDSNQQLCPWQSRLFGEVWRACLDMSLQADGPATPTGGQLYMPGFSSSRPFV